VRFDPAVFHPDGTIADPGTENFLRAFMTEFRDHVQRVLTVLPRP